MTFSRKHRRKSLASSLGAFVLMGASIIIGLLIQPPKAIFAGGFMLLFSIAVISWGLVLAASWFDSDPAATGGLQSFAGVAWRGFARAFLVVWFAVGLLLLALSVTSFVGYFTTAG